MVSSEKNKISIVAPVYNEESLITEFLDELENIINEFPNYHFEIILVNDGSTDKTHLNVVTFKNSNKKKYDIKIIKLSKNFGHQAALLCGLESAEGDYVITLDSDLQDPPFLIRDFILHAENGFDIVLGKRIKRNGESFLKQFSARCFYFILNLISDTKFIKSIGDFRLLNRRALNALLNTVDKEPYLRGLVFWIGFKTQIIEYERLARLNGRSKYSISKMIQLGISGILNFSLKPLKLSLYFGFILSLVTISYSLYIFFQKIIYPENSLPGYASLLVVILWGFSIQYVSLGILSNYVLQLIKQNQKRPNYIIQEVD